MLGFLDLSADVTGFKLDKEVLVGSLFFAVVYQLLKDNLPKKKNKLIKNGSNLKQTSYERSET